MESTKAAPALTAEQANRIDGARLRVVAHPEAGRPYYSRPLMALSRPIPTEEIGTMAVDSRWRLYVNPRFLDGVSSEELAAALVHEIHHLIRVHPDRAETAGVGEGQHERWNIAADCEINPDVIGDGFALPDWVVMPSKFGFEDGLLAEQYYRLLADALPDAGEGEGGQAGPGIGEPGDCGSCAGGGDRDHEDGGGPGGERGIGPSHGDVLRRQTARDVSDYARAKGRGEVPGGLLRWAEELLEPKVDWRRTLSSMIRNASALAAGKTDYTYSRMSRRSTSQVLFPALRQPVPEVAVVVDTSGSMSDGDLAAALAEVEGILRQVGCGSGALSVLTVDAAVQTVQRVSTARRVEVRGGGGTDMRVGIDEAMGLRPRPNVVVVLTDGWTPWPDVPPALPVVVGVIGEPPAAGSPWNIPEWMPFVVIPPA